MMLTRRVLGWRAVSSVAGSTMPCAVTGRKVTSTPREASDWEVVAGGEHAEEREVVALCAA